MEKSREQQASAGGPGRLVELGWAPTVTVVYIVWSLATARPLDYLLLAALVALSVTAVMYAQKVRQALESRPEPAPVQREIPRPQPPRVEQTPRVEPPVVRNAPPEPAPQPVVRSEPSPAEPPKSKPVETAKEAKKTAPEKPPDTSAIEKQLEAVKGELERSKQSAAALQAKLAEKPQGVVERSEFASTIIGLKERARAFRRQWPDAAFCQRPLRQAWWTPSPTQTAATTWLARAQEWHTQFQDARKRLFPSAPGDVYLQSLDLEEIIDLLDDVMLSRDASPLHRETSLAAAKAPVVVISAWGAPEGEDERCGFWIRNTSEMPATNIQLTRALVGARYLSIFLPPSSVLNKDQKVFAIASISGPQRATAYHLEDVFRKLPVNSLNGAKPLGIGLRLIYEAKDGTRYASRHEMTLEDTGTLKITYLNSEVLGMPV
jgi:outer membrane biosynthesis protein TonB